VDAAITSALMAGLGEPPMCGLGGDMFAMIKLAKEDKIIGVNASGRAPKALNAELLRQKGCSVVDPDSVHAITVPGAVSGFCRMAEDHGRLGLASCLQPVIEYAEAGVPLAPRVASTWAKQYHRLKGQGPKW